MASTSGAYFSTSPFYGLFFNKKGILIFLFFLSINALSQDNIPSSMSGVEVGSKKYYKIHMTNGVSYKARIVSIDKTQILIMMSNGRTMTIPPSEVQTVSEQAINSMGSIGLGYGVPYGGLGANGDVRVYKSFYLSGGVGTVDFVSVMYSVGAKYYLRSGNYKWRPRVFLNYGPYGIVRGDDYYASVDINERYNSLMLGVGQQWTLGITKSWGFDCDIHYVVDQRGYTDAVELYESQGIQIANYHYLRFTFSIGLRYCF